MYLFTYSNANKRKYFQKSAGMRCGTPQETSDSACPLAIDERLPRLPARRRGLVSQTVLRGKPDIESLPSPRKTAHKVPLLWRSRKTPSGLPVDLRAARSSSGQRLLSAGCRKIRPAPLSVPSLSLQTAADSRPRMKAVTSVYGLSNTTS